jgi:MFS transporter, DHA2 family, multidrug resistance protein
MALGTLPNEQLGSATGIQNLLRNIGGGIGISFVSTMLSRYAQAHQVFLAAHVSELNPIYQQRLGALRQLFEGHFSPADALIRAQASISNTVAQQVNYWAFVQLFYVIAWVCAICVLGIFLFRSVKSTGPIAAH